VVGAAIEIKLSINIYFLGMMFADEQQVSG
jgi:hypothetical protein